MMNIKQRIHAAGVFQWEVAEKMGISEFTLSRWLRRPEQLGQKVVAQIEKALQEIVTERGEQDE